MANIVKEEINAASMAEFFEKPLFIKGEVPYMGDRYTEWTATYKFLGKNYKISFSPWPDDPRLFNGAWTWTNNGNPKGMFIDGSQEDFNDDFLKIYVNGQGEIRSLTDIESQCDQTQIDMEKTIPELLKRWLYLQAL